MGQCNVIIEWFTQSYDFILITTGLIVVLYYAMSGRGVKRVFRELFQTPCKHCSEPIFWADGNVQEVADPTSKTPLRYEYTVDENATARMTAVYPAVSIKTCSHCKTSNTMHWWFGEVCVPMGNERRPIEPCDTCNGTGGWGGVLARCQTCNGRGWRCISRLVYPVSDE